MKYISTRGGVSPISFREAVMMGLARDGGLLLPQKLPQVSEQKLEAWQNLSYQQLSFEVLSLFIDDIPSHHLEEMVEKAYGSFSHPQVTPLRKVGGLYILELFHGPTLAFKDVALQLLGNLFEYQLASSHGKMNILGATSGDTGSAAIAGVKGKKGINIFILHPHERTSPIQALQMTTVLDSNVFNLAVRGTFDDAQAIVKSLFNDLEFKDTYHLGAINSINWARVLAQVVYYVYAYLRLKKNSGEQLIDFSVPTGNFGDIFAGFVAKKLLPHGCIDTLILATNENDLLTRFVDNGDYSKGKVVSTSSPSMDIQIASNFERYLYYLRKEDGKQVKADMETFATTGKLDLSNLQDEVRADFVSRSVSEEETIQTIRLFHEETNYLLDPHTAIGVKAAQACTNNRPVVCLATAHPAKFGDAVSRAIGREPELPPALASLSSKESRCEIIEAKMDVVKQYIEQYGLI